jgi:GNAT superfamily N-acetyltransferase
VAERQGRVVGRIAAIHNQLHNDTHHDRVGFFGFFECDDDQAVAEALFAAAIDWLRGRGLDTMRGPASFSVNDELGLLVDGFDTPPTLMMPHNPPYYLQLIETAGFVKAKDLLVYEGGHPTRYAPVPERLARGTQLMAERLGVTLRPLRMDDFDAELARIKSLYQRCWEKNWGFVPMTEAEIDHLAAQFKPVVVPDLVPFIEKDGEPIGFALALPDLNVVLRHNRKGWLLPALLPLFWALKRRTIRRTRILLLGVVPEWRGRGLDAVLYHWVWTRAARHGMYWGEASWILEDNPAIIAGLVKMGFNHYKTYRVYDRPL